MESHEIKCDQCGKDLTYTGNCEDYFLVLGNQTKAPWFAKTGERGGALTCMAIRPPVDRTYRFCGLVCLDTWRDVAREKAAKQKAWRDANRKPVEGTPGFFTCPDLPEELR